MLVEGLLVKVLVVGLRDSLAKQDRPPAPYLPSENEAKVALGTNWRSFDVELSCALLVLFFYPYSNRQLISPFPWKG